MNIKAGKYYYCFKTVKMSGSNREVYTKGKVYFSEYNNKLTDNEGETYHGITPDYAEDHFVEVDAVVKAYAEGIRARANTREAV